MGNLFTSEWFYGHRNWVISERWGRIGNGKMSYSLRQCWLSNDKCAHLIMNAIFEQLRSHNLWKMSYYLWYVLLYRCSEYNQLAQQIMFCLHKFRFSFIQHPIASCMRYAFLCHMWLKFNRICLDYYSGIFWSTCWRIFLFFVVLNRTSVVPVLLSVLRGVYL